MKVVWTGLILGVYDKAGILVLVEGLYVPLHVALKLGNAVLYQG